jgi:hypothetical protein
MQAGHHIKRILFKFYALFSVLVFIVTILLSIFGAVHWGVLATITGGILTFAFTVQKQQLEEIRLFKDLFEQFNARYDEMNDDLNLIHQRAPDLLLTEDEKKQLFKYFNLCGEEFLYFEKGFIYPEVWAAWDNGMKFFRKNARIKKLWNEDLGSDSYYGLKF